jgi:hypothetical protein
MGRALHNWLVRKAQYIRRKRGVKVRGVISHHETELNNALMEIHQSNDINYGVSNHVVDQREEMPLLPPVE